MRQHTRPIIVSDGSASVLSQLEYTEKAFNEQWLQDIIHNYPGAMPINEIEPVFSDPVALCKELETKSGFIDNVFINPQGYITLIECKLWRNPDARRKVLAQILDYAKDLAQWDYAVFEKSILKARNGSEKTLLEMVANYFPDLDESAFSDNVTRNLKNARFLLLIVGDGIRENAEELLDFLNRHGNMHFVLAFVELPVFKLGDKSDFLITPRIIAKTTELKRFTEAITDKEEELRPQSASESVFYERLENNIGKPVTQLFKAFVKELEERFNINTKMGRGKKLSLNLKTEDDFLNLGSIQEDGNVNFYGVVTKTSESGDRQIGIDYLKQLASIIEGDFHTDFNEWSWCVKNNGRYPDIGEFMSRKSEWIKSIEDVITKLKKLDS